MKAVKMHIGVHLINKISVIATDIEQKLHDWVEISTYLKKMDVIMEGQKC